MKPTNHLKSHNPESNIFNCFKMIPIKTMKPFRLKLVGECGNMYFTKRMGKPDPKFKRFYNRKTRYIRKQFLRQELCQW